MSLRSVTTALGRILAGGDRRRRRPPGNRPRPAASDAPAIPADTAATITELDVAAHGLPRLEYAPQPDGEPDPGEVVWGWVPFEDDPRQGKDRPILVVGRGAGALVGLQMTSKDHDRDRADELRYGRVWFDVGSGAWDSQGRESEVRLDRLLRVPPSAVRREGATLSRDRYTALARALRELHER
ncbi:hypothetical protein Bcav_1741 [Beutenbergia cavernae DSM 12333]|uniref:PemK family protein n=1 Tax=Beutenbergia cavernae (strain ATCC BAA-8 / DSM 12333 / CCUG 43141 / JCM 11478 / NBRC 16432 / NCIMB 13614 / HKI 0122) TaxID=471853 RepID=C5C484_BEUC1|nr:type II toxin-antitoxin system PemK/MazF family toxin [Beutenbergia cavernae]ACQ79997.1 hypothetical protein Bcav_1741 [Beutenbergia cavernae DSM 12333]